jgi:hypothetical protein
MFSVIQSHGRDAAPACQIGRSHRAWNADVPILALPDELLVDIAERSIYSSDLESTPSIHLSLTSISRRLRILFVRTPKLWNYIYSGWTTSWIDHCVRRSGDLSLSMNVFLFALTEDALECMVRCLPRVVSLDMEEYRADMWHEAGQQFIDAWSDQGLQRLQYLQMFGNIAQYLIVGNDSVLPAASVARLSTLSIGNGVATTLPDLPELQKLYMTCTRTPLAQLHRCFSRSPRLTQIYLHYATDVYLESLEGQDVTMVLAHVDLPHLTHLYILDHRVAVLWAVHILPNPSLALHVEMEIEVNTHNDDKIPVWSSSAAPYGPVWAKLSRFWRTASGLATLPVGKAFTHLWPSTEDNVEDVAEDDPANVLVVLEFCAGPQFDQYCTTPSFFFACTAKLMQDDEALERVTALTMFHDEKNATQLPGCNHIFRCLPGVVQVNLSFSEAYSAGINEFHDWLVTQCRGWPALRSIVFEECIEDARPLFVRLRQAHPDLAVTWTRGPPAREFLHPEMVW